MAYTPHEWESGEVLTPAKLNTLTTAIGEMDMSYTPKTWHDGDILSAAEMNRIENAVASGGGGGGGDFSKAEVTLIPSRSGYQFGLYDEGYYDEPWGFHCSYISNGQIVSGFPSINVEEETTFTIYYVGESLPLLVSGIYVSSTGDVTYNSENNTLTITGDCSITGYID